MASDQVQIKDLTTGTPTGSDYIVFQEASGDERVLKATKTSFVGALTWVSEEEPSDDGDQTNFTLAHTPASGTFKLFRGGARQQGGGVDYTLTETALVLTSALATGEVLIADYGYQA